jgi:hypothetical protein|nr:hypothetical protein [Candidatus Undinarchaeales archaeon ERR594346 U_76725]|tara:strand:- start:16126 stop:16272 length:147 start_codon:yes stop_codon:yes gene_type:complete
MAENSKKKKGDKKSKSSKDPFKEVSKELKKYRKGVLLEELEPSECSCS